MRGVPYMSAIEEIGTDARKADGYVVLFRHGRTHTGVLVVPVLLSRSTSSWWKLKRLTAMVEAVPKLRSEMFGYNITPRTVGKKSRAPSIYEISFAVKNGSDSTVELFLEFARQTEVLTNPIVSDMRGFDA